MGGGIIFSPKRGFFAGPFLGDLKRETSFKILGFGFYRRPGGNLWPKRGSLVGAVGVAIK